MKNQNKLLRLKPFLLALTVLVFLISAIPVYAQTQLYVAPAPTGSSSNTGLTSSSPKATIAQAHALIPAGGGHYTVNVAPGTYVGAINTTKPGTSSTQRITYKSTTRWGAKIVLAASNAEPEVWDNNAANVTIDGFEVDGTYTSGTRAKLGIYMRLSNSTVQNCIVHDIFTSSTGSGSGGGGGIQMESYYGATNMHVLSNKVYNVGPWGHTNGRYYHGIYHQSTGSIKNNITFRNSGAGIHMWHNDRDIDVINNTTFNNVTGIVWGGGDYYTGWSGPARNIRMQNNIVAYNSGYGFLENGQNSTTSPHTITYNMVYQNGVNFQLVVTPQSNNIVGNPNFVNYTGTNTGDYHLTSASTLAINAGLSTYAPATDYDGVTRTGNPDLGAYEYVASCGETSVPATPGSPTATANSSSQITVTWTNTATNESNYLVERSTSATTGFVQIASLAANTTSYVNNTGLSASTTYYYRVRASNCFGNSAYSTVVNATTPAACGAPSVPNPPLNTAATANSSSQITVTWTDNSGIEENWLVERSTNATTGFVQIASLAPNTVSYVNNTGLSAGTTYYYRVRAVNCFGYSSYSAVVNATTSSACGAPSVPNPPLSTAASAVSYHQIDVTWTDNSGLEENWLVERSTNATTGFTVIATLPAVPGYGSNTSYTDWFRSPSTTYYYKVRAVNCFGYSTYSATVNATTPACNAPSVPNPPLNTAASSVSSSQINITWTDNSGLESAWLIERSTNATTGFVVVATLAPVAGYGSNTSYSDAGLASSTTYYYKVRAQNCFGYSTYSATVNATTASGFMSASSSTAEASEPMSSQIRVYPNPSVTNFTLTIPSDVVIKGAMMKIYDRYGKEVKSVSISSNITTIERGSLQSGIYYFHIINNNDRIYNGKLMISNE